LEQVLCVLMLFIGALYADALQVLFLLMLFIFYLGVCLYRKDMTFVNDLRKVCVCVCARACLRACVPALIYTFFCNVWVCIAHTLTNNNTHSCQQGGGKSAWSC